MGTSSGFSILSEISPARARSVDPLVTGLKVFIVGAARSGTSILFHAMREVFELPGHGEGHVIPQIQSLIHQFHAHAGRFRGNQGVLASRLDTASFASAMYGFLRDFYVETYGDSWVDKTPGADSVIATPTILNLFPTARVICMRRHGIEVVRSSRRKFGSAFMEACQDWADGAASLVSIRELGLPVLEVDQGDLVADPGSQARRIAAHLGAPPRADALEAFFRTQRVEVTAEQDWARRPALEETDWSPEQKELFARICGPAMTSLGYA